MSERTEWPALMRSDTLQEYLDCRTKSDFAHMMRKLRQQGYPGRDPRFGKHVKDTVDRYISPEDRTTSGEEKALEALRRSA